MDATAPSSSATGRARLLRLVLGVWPLAALATTPAGAQIFKCIVDSGNVTYQNEPCPKNAKAERVDLFDNSWTADRVEKDAQWRRTAAEHHVVAGMPQRWVREALGEPTEVRDTATAGAKEVWLYNFPERSVQVGILADQVLWFRETPVIGSLTRAATEFDRTAVGAQHAAPGAAAAASDAPRAAPDAPRPAPDIPPTAPAGPRVLPDAPRAAPEVSLTTPAAPRSLPDTARAIPDTPRPAPEISPSAQVSPRISESTHGVARGQDCKQALAELGTPSRQREVPAFDSASGPTTEYFYEPAGSESPTRTRIVCANGRVEGVDRTIVR
ncbi:MAG TPA: DUF4124 domain-containing protein [Casimicrobiaceae bacterium]|jgi:hypothetical protein|nr:DUF4124 domain-containing protein [Casimicrobiaceae bacterium]